MEKNIIEDIGEKIGGAKKDLWKNRYMTISDLEKLNDIEKDKFVTKDMIWPKPDYKKLYEEKDEDGELVASIKVLRDKISAKPRKLGKRYELENPYRTYIEIISTVRNLIMGAESVDELRGVYHKVNELFEPTELYSIYKNNSSPLYFFGQEQNSARKLVNKGFPLKKQTRNTTEKTNKLKKPLKKKLDALEMYGFSFNLDKNVTGEDFINTFNFRGVEFGNYLNQKERQDTINIAYKSLIDFSEIIEIEPKDVSLNGTLAIAFGARGRGTASAHYEPARRVLNMTKLNGAGFLAHEWFHAFDHYIGSGEDVNKHDYASNTNMHPLYKEFEELKHSIVRKLLTHEQVLEDLETNIENLKEGYQSSLKKADEYEEKGQHSIRTIDKYRNDLKKYYVPRIENLEKKKVLFSGSPHLITEKDRSKQSDFVKEALILDKNKPGKYWSKLIELSARSFESYIFDEIIKREARSDYLVHSVDEGLYSDKDIYLAEPYPVGEERKTINEAYSKIMEEFRNQYINNNKLSY